MRGVWGKNGGTCSTGVWKKNKWQALSFILSKEKNETLIKGKSLLHARTHGSSSSHPHTTLSAPPLHAPPPRPPREASSATPSPFTPLLARKHYCICVSFFFFDARETGAALIPLHGLKVPPVGDRRQRFQPPLTSTPAPPRPSSSSIRREVRGDSTARHRRASHRDWVCNHHATTLLRSWPRTAGSLASVYLWAMIGLGWLGKMKQGYLALKWGLWDGVLVLWFFALLFWVVRADLRWRRWWVCVVMEENGLRHWMENERFGVLMMV